MPNTAKVRHMIRTVSDLSSPLLSPSRKREKSSMCALRVDELHEGMATVTGSSAGVARAEAHGPSIAGQNSKSSISAIDNEPTCSLLLQGSHATNTNRNGMYLTGIDTVHVDQLIVDQICDQSPTAEKQVSLPTACVSVISFV